MAGLERESLVKDRSSVSGSSDPDESVGTKDATTNVQADDSPNSQLDAESDSFMTKAALEGKEFNKVLHAEKYAAKYDFAGSSHIELNFTKESIILVIEKAANGWWRGVHKDKVGWFPESYMKPTSLGKANLVSRSKTELITRREHTECAGKAVGNVERPRNMDDTMAAGTVTNTFSNFLTYLHVSMSQRVMSMFPLVPPRPFAPTYSPINFPPLLSLSPLAPFSVLLCPHRRKRA